MQITCKTYQCKMEAVACAARYINSQVGGQSPVGNQKCGKCDPNCLVCDDGKRRMKEVGKVGVAEYRAMLNQVKNTARARAMVAARLGRRS